MLTSLRSPMELTENDRRDLIPMNGGAGDGGGESSDGGGAREAGSSGGTCVKKEVLTAMEEVKAAVELLGTM